MKTAKMFFKFEGMGVERKENNKIVSIAVLFEAKHVFWGN